MTTIRVRRFVNCPFSATIELAEKAAGQWNGLYLTPSPPLGERVHFVAGSVPDATDGSRKHDALLVAWRPQTKRLFPDFRGAITVRPKRRGAWIRLEGQYEPPYGSFGKVFDFFVGRAIARRTMRHFLGDLAGQVETEYQRERETRASSIGETDVQSNPLPH